MFDGSPEQGRRILSAMAAVARTDMLRRNRISITGDWVEDTSACGEWLSPYRGAPDAALTERYAALGDKPAGTFGRAFHEFYIDNGFGLAGQEESAAEEAADGQYPDWYEPTA